MAVCGHEWLMYMLMGKSCHLVSSMPSIKRFNMVFAPQSAAARCDDLRWPAQIAEVDPHNGLLKGG